MSPVDAALWLAFVALVAPAIALSLPRPPSFDPARLLGLLVATLHRGEVERTTGDASDWEARIARSVPREIPHPPGGWRVDPADLGASHDLQARIGVGASWEAVARGDASVDQALARATTGLCALWFEPPIVELPGLGVHVLGEIDPAGILPLLADPADRLLVCAGTRAQEVLALLAENPGLRDRVRAVLLVGARVDPAWLAVHFTQRAFDTELARSTPYLVLRVGDSPRIAEPSLPASGRRPVAVTDLGVLDPGSVADPAVARALPLLVAALG
jgi:hypothetical protein